MNFPLRARELPARDGTCALLGFGALSAFFNVLMEVWSLRSGSCLV